MFSLSPGALTAALFVCAVTAVAAEIKVLIKTDDHPTETSWSLIDACPGGRDVITGGGYTSNGVVETTTVMTRASRYLFTIVDSGGDGLCCDHGADGYYKVLEDGVEQVSGGEFEITEGKFFGTCTEPTTNKPTNQVTSPPTSNSDLVAISTEIKFDQYPSDTSWKMENICSGDSKGKVLAEDGPYPETPEYQGQTKTVFNTVTSNGLFKFTINDTFGDGLCCDHGNGGYTITYGTEKIQSDFGKGSAAAFQETKEFGSEAKCLSSGGSKATYDAAFRAPRCGSVDPSGICTTAGTGLLDCKTPSDEPNGPNTLDSCTDGPGGVCLQDESIQDITVMSTNGGPLSNGHRAKIKATVYAYGDGSEDQADFFYTTNPGPNPKWKFLSSARPTAGGKVVLESKEFLIEAYKVQAVRVNFRWVGSVSVPPESCSGEDYNDVDDLVFTVEPDCALPEGTIPNCAKYMDMAGGASRCFTCAEHYEVNPTGDACTPCVVCKHPIDDSKTLDFCPDLVTQYGGVVPHKDDGSYVLWPAMDTDICKKYVRWGPAGWDVEDRPKFYCGDRDTRDPNQHVAWVYNISVSQESSELIDGVEREVIMMKSGMDTDYKVPGRPVYACHNDTILAETVNDFPHHVSGAAYFEGCDKGIGCPGPDPKQDIMGFTFHWHGMIHLNNQFMDGVAMVSQCPIGNLDDNFIPCSSQYNDPAENTFTYAYLADPGGTYWFHSHTGLQYGDGLFASLIIYEPERENVYHNDYEVDLHPIIMGDWWHALSQDLIVELYFGIPNPPYDDTGGGLMKGVTADHVCELNQVKCTQWWKPDSASAFNCLCAGGASDYPFKSGHFQGHGQYPEITKETTPAEAMNQKFYEVNVVSDKRYRLRIVNGGFNFGLRFSIDSHLYDVVAADGQYLKKEKDCSHFSVMPGERYDIIFASKSERELAVLGGSQFFIRATTFNHTYWKQSAEHGYTPEIDPVYHQIFAVLNYAPSTKLSDWFAPNSKLAADLAGPTPPVTKVVDISFFYNTAQWASLGDLDVSVVNKIHGYRKDGIPGCTKPIHVGGGPHGAPFGCTPEGKPLPIPDPDLVVHIFVNGIMYPAYNLFLAVSPVMSFETAKSMPRFGFSTIGQANMFARSTVPLVYTPTDESAYRNLDVWGPPTDSPAWNPNVNSTRYDWGSSLKQNFGSKEMDSNEYFPNGHGITNKTLTVRLPVNKWVMVIQHNAGPMTHPFHIHGTDEFTLARQSKQGTDIFKKVDNFPDCGMCACRLDTGKAPWNNPNRVPQMLDPVNPACQFDGGNYVNGYGLDLIPPISNRYQVHYEVEDWDDATITNKIDPPTRDMPVVPPHGYVVWQWYTGNPGAWFYHCHLEFHAGLGMGIVWMIGEEEDEWLNGKLSSSQINAYNQGNCKDVEFEGPFQFY